MESEEYEQIPWSNLVAEAKPPIDRRVYFVTGGVALIVVLILAMRTFGSNGPIVAAPEQTPTTAELVEVPDEFEGVVEPVAVPVVPVTEADLLAAGGASGTDERLTVAEFTAEWFVTDFYTRDGSAETLTSLRAMMSEAIAADLPHLDPGAGDSFVEWARAFHVEDKGATVEVSVAYRTIHASDGGYERDPVEAVIVTLAEREDQWQIQTRPAITALP